MGGSTTQSSNYMPAGMFGGMPAGGQFGGGLGGGMYGQQPGFGFPQTGSGKGFQAQPPPRPGTQPQYAQMNFLPPQFSQPRFYYPTIQGQMFGQSPIPLVQPFYRPAPLQARPPQPQIGGGKGFQGMPTQPNPFFPQPMLPGRQPLPIGPPSGGFTPNMPGGRQPQFAELGPTDGGGANLPIRQETEDRVSIMPIRDEYDPLQKAQPIYEEPTMLPPNRAEYFGSQDADLSDYPFNKV